jgi:WD40 repeat protein
MDGTVPSVEDLCLSHDGRWVLAAGGPSNTMKMWSAETGALAHEFIGHTDRVVACDFAPNDATVASAGWDGTVKVWSTSDAREIATLVGHEGRVTGCGFVAGGHRLLTAGQDLTLRLWDVATCREIGRLPDVGAVSSLATSADGRTAAICDAAAFLHILEVEG